MNAGQPESVLSKLDLQLALLVDHKLSPRKQNSCALFLIRVVDVDFTATQAVGGRWGIRPDLAESQWAVGDKANLPPRRSLNHPDETAVVAKGSDKRETSDGSYFRECVDEPLALTLLECLDKDLSVLLIGILVNDHSKVSGRPGLGAGPHRNAFNRLGFRPALGEGRSASQRQQPDRQ